MPVSNLQAEEVQNIVNIIANCDNLTVGRTEEIIGYTFTILKKLVLDDGEEGAQFRRFHAATVHMALDVLGATRRATRATSGRSRRRRPSSRRRARGRIARAARTARPRARAALPSRASGARTRPRAGRRLLSARLVLRVDRGD